MNLTKLLMGLLVTAISALSFSSCSKDEDAKKPEAFFSYTCSGDGRTINFTNKSTEAISYLWDFGDGFTSTEENPVHTFAEYKDYFISLIATGKGGENTFMDTIAVTKSSGIKLDDGVLTDWDTIPDAFVSLDNNGGVINKVKLDYDGDFIYFYMEVQDNLSDSLPTGIYFDLDNDSTTGFTPWTHHAIGADLYIEAGITTGSWASMYEVDSSLDPDWPWAEADVSDFIVNGTHIQDGPVVKVEWAFRKSKLAAPQKGMVLGKKVSIIMMHYVDWNPAGFFPGQGDAAYVFEMP